jgi:hypothetical protein
MRRLAGIAFSVAVLGAAFSALAQSASAPAPAATASALSAAAKAAKAIPYDSVADFLKLPNGVYLGEVAGVATNSQGHIFVFHRTGSETMVVGAARAFVSGGSKLFEFDQNGNYLREIGRQAYGIMGAHAVRVDAQDNIWTVDEAANVVIKFDPAGRIAMVFGRKPEAITVPTKPGPAGSGLGVPGDTFNGVADVAWDGAGNIFFADGSGNARVVKLDKDGNYIKAWGGRGSGPGQFGTLHSIAVDAAGNVYVADRGNDRIQIFDNNGTFKSQITGIGVPWAICISPGPQQFLYSSNSNAETNLDNGEIYKMDLTGKILGKFGTAGKNLKEFGTVHAIDCRTPNTVIVGELINWRVQKIVLKTR